MSDHKITVDDGKFTISAWDAGSEWLAMWTCCSCGYNPPGATSGKTEKQAVAACQPKCALHWGKCPENPKRI